MKHFIDLDTPQLRKLYNLVFDKRDMKDIADKLHTHMKIVKQREQ